MYSRKRRVAVNHVEQMREARKTDMPYQNLRRRGQETAEAEEGRRADRRTSSLPKTNRCKARTYEIPRGEALPVFNKFSSSVNSTRSKMRNSVNKGSVSRLPAISTGTQRSGIQRRTEELATTSKTLSRTIAPLASDCKEQSPPCHKQKIVGIKSRARKWSESDAQLNPQKPTRSQGLLRGRSKKGVGSCDHTNTSCDHTITSNVSTRRDRVSRSLDVLSLPQPLTASGHFYTIWPGLPSLQYPHSPSPDVPEPHPLLPEISDPFEGSSVNNSLIEKDILSEVSYQAELSDSYQAELSDSYRAELSSRDSAATSVSSVPEPLLSQCPSSGSSMDTSLLGLHEPLTSAGPLSSLLFPFDLQSSESDGEDGGYSWQDDFTARESCYVPVQRVAFRSQSSSHALMSHSPGVGFIHLRGRRTEQSIESTSTQPEDPSSSTTSHTVGGCRPVLPLIPVGRQSPLPVSTSPSVTHRTTRWTFTSSEELGDEPLTELVHISPRRDNHIWFGSDGLRGVPPPRRSFTLRHSHLPFRQEEEPEEVRGGTRTSSSSTGDNFGLTDNQVRTILVLNAIRTEVAEHQMTSTQVGETQSATTNPERLRKIKESLLAESSDEDEGDLCRICHSGAVYPTNPLLSPCQCSGSLQYIHHICLKTWIQAKIHTGTTLSAVKTCEMCQGSLSVDLLDWDMEEFYHRHRQTQVEWASPEQSMLQLQRLFELLQVVHSNTNIVFQVWRLPFLLRTETQSQRREPGSQTPETPDPLT